MTNQELIKKYPFLQVKDMATGEPLPDELGYCLIKDNIPRGWWKRFGIPLCDDLKEVLEKNNYLNDYYIAQCKEKYGSLRIYDFGAPEEWYDHMYAWEYISKYTCMWCGDFPSPVRDNGWIACYCDDCISKFDLNYSMETTLPLPALDEFITIEEYRGNGIKRTKQIDLKPFYKKNRV